MQIFNYQIAHSIGSASGSLKAASSEEAIKKLRKQYETSYIDEEGAEIKVLVTKIALSGQDGTESVYDSQN